MLGLISYKVIQVACIALVKKYPNTKQAEKSESWNPSKRFRYFVNVIKLLLPEYFTVTATTVTKTMCEVQLTWKCQNARYSRYFNGKLRNGQPKYGHIRYQRIQTNSNRRFVIHFYEILCLTGFPLFSAVILDRMYQPRMMGFNPIQRNEFKNIFAKFGEN